MAIDPAQNRPDGSTFPSFIRRPGAFRSTGAITSTRPRPGSSRANPSSIGDQEAVVLAQRDRPDHLPDRDRDVRADRDVREVDDAAEEVDPDEPPGAVVPDRALGERRVGIDDELDLVVVGHPFNNGSMNAAASRTPGSAGWNSSSFSIESVSS